MSDDGWGGFTPEPPPDPTLPLAAPVPPVAPPPVTPPLAPTSSARPPSRRTALSVGVVVALVVGIGAAVAAARRGAPSSSDTTLAISSTAAETTAEMTAATVGETVPADSVPADSPYAAEVRASLTPYSATEQEIGCVTGVADHAGTDAATDPAVAAQVVACLTTRTLGQLLAEELQKTTGVSIDGVCVGKDLDGMSADQRSALLTATSSGVDDGSARTMLTSLVDDCRTPDERGAAHAQ